MKKLILTSVILLLCITLNAQTTGPENGHLIIAGGALRDTAVFNQFIELAGGKGKAHVVIIPTAGGYEVNEQRRTGLIKQWKARGAAEVSVLHTTDPAEADTEAFASVIDKAGGVYFPGGRQWRLADAYLNTLVHEN